MRQSVPSSAREACCEPSHYFYAFSCSSWGTLKSTMFAPSKMHFLPLLCDITCIPQTLYLKVKPGLRGGCTEVVGGYR